MPADTKARYYQWFMTDEHNARLVGYEWHPEDGKIVSSMTLGRLTFMHRDEPGDAWAPPIEVAPEIPWVVAQTMTRNEGFHVEVAVI